MLVQDKGRKIQGKAATSSMALQKIWIGQFSPSVMMNICLFKETENVDSDEQIGTDRNNDRVSTSAGT